MIEPHRGGSIHSFWSNWTRRIIDPEGDIDVADFVSLEVEGDYLFASAGSDCIYLYDLSVLPATPFATRHQHFHAFLLVF